MHCYSDRSWYLLGTMRLKWTLLILVSVSALFIAGCGRFLAGRLVKAPNTYPDWIKKQMPVYLEFDSNVLTNFPLHSMDVGPPRARLQYRVIEPRDYKVSSNSTNWQEQGKTWFKFTFRQEMPGSPTRYTGAPRGLIVLLHGYSLNHRRMVPWAFLLAQKGWRCVLVDLRGHGKSTGKRIHFGVVETNDLSQLLNEFARRDQLVEPVGVLGESYGAALALRWKTVEPRVHSVVAIAPYAELSRAVLKIREQNASFVPEFLIKTGLKHLPKILRTNADDLDVTTVLRRSPIAALFVAGANDTIAPKEDTRRLHALAAEPSRLLVVPRATHEAVPYFFDELTEPVISWLQSENESN